MLVTSGGKTGQLFFFRKWSVYGAEQLWRKWTSLFPCLMQLNQRGQGIDIAAPQNWPCGLIIARGLASNLEKRDASNGSFCTLYQMKLWQEKFQRMEPMLLTLHHHERMEIYFFWIILFSNIVQQYFSWVVHKDIFKCYLNMGLNSQVAPPSTQISAAKLFYGAEIFFATNSCTHSVTFTYVL